jgi:hypothetical protein
MAIKEAIQRTFTLRRHTTECGVECGFAGGVAGGFVVSDAIEEDGVFTNVSGWCDEITLQKYEIFWGMLRRRVIYPIGW